jgi:hypothetical protein
VLLSSPQGNSAQLQSIGASDVEHPEWRGACQYEPRGIATPRAPPSEYRNQLAALSASRHSRRRRRGPHAAAGPSPRREFFPTRIPPLTPSSPERFPDRPGQSRDISRGAKDLASSETDASPWPGSGWD